jgi:hypothetical protein
MTEAIGDRGEADRLLRFGQAHQPQQRMRRDREEAGLDEGEQGQPPFGARMRGLGHGPVVEAAKHGQGIR